MEELKKNIDDLNTKVRELTQRLDALGNVATLPFEVQEAITLRIPTLSATGTGSATTQTISLSGNAEDITVPAQPSGTLVITSSGVTYELLYK